MTRRVPNVCDRVRAALAQGTRDTFEESHLFSCPSCRTEARIAAAWRAFPRPDEGETETGRVDEAFVRGVIGRLRDQERTRFRQRAGWAAAAALLFFFLAGAGQKLASMTSASTDETYASMLTPSLDAYIPQ